jgi:hypothetical protein
MSERLVDLFQAELRSRGLGLPGSLGTCGIFGDLLWPPFGDRNYLLTGWEADPAFTLTGPRAFDAKAQTERHPHDRAEAPEPWTRRVAAS